MDTPLTKFFATVGFKTDTSAWDATIKKVRSDLTSLRSKTISIRLKYTGGKSRLPNVVQQVRLKYTGTRRSLPEVVQRVRFQYAPKLQRVERNNGQNAHVRVYQQQIRDRQLTLRPALKQEVRLFYTNRLTTLPPLTQQVNIRNRGGGTRGGTGGTEAGGSPNPWQMAGTGGLLSGNNVRAFGATIGISGIAKQMYDTANYQVALEPQYEFLTGSAKEAEKQIAFVNKLADDLHINLRDTSKSYGMFLGASASSIGAEKAQKSFETIQKFGVMMGATPDTLKRGTYAIQQIEQGLAY